MSRSPWFDALGDAARQVAEAHDQHPLLARDPRDPGARCRNAQARNVEESLGGSGWRTVSITQLCGDRLHRRTACRASEATIEIEALPLLFDIVVRQVRGDRQVEQRNLTPSRNG